MCKESGSKTVRVPDEPEVDVAVFQPGNLDITVVGRCNEVISRLVLNAAGVVIVRRIGAMPLHGIEDEINSEG